MTQCNYTTNQQHGAFIPNSQNWNWLLNLFLSSYVLRAKFKLAGTISMTDNCYIYHGIFLAPFLVILSYMWLL